MRRTPPSSRCPRGKRSRRPLVTIATALVAVAAGIGLWRGGLASRGWVDQLQPERAYTLETIAGRTTVDLEFPRERRYLLVVSSLAEADRTCTLTLDASPRDDVARLPAREIPPLRARNIPSNSSSRVRRVGDRAASPAATTNRLPPRRPPADASRATDERRLFWLHVADSGLEDPAGYVRVEGTVVAESRRVRVYLDRAAAGDAVDGDLPAEVVRLLEKEIMPGCAAHVGRWRDVDGDGKFGVLLTPWLSHLQGGRVSLGGFVRGSDFRPGLKAPFSNHGDLLYLNTNLHAGPHLKTLLAHEFTHAVCFSERFVGRPDRPPRPAEDDWLNEAIAHVAENTFGGGWSNLDHRVSRFLDDTTRAPLVVEDYYRAGRWRDHGCRGSTYLFLRWCVDRFGGGLLRKLVVGGDRGIRNLEQATGERFDDLYRHWTLALVRSGRTSGTSRTRGVRNRRTAGYRTLDLYGRLGSRALAGPRLRRWDVDEGQRTLALTGTSSAFVELTASGAPGVRRIRLRGRGDAALQVSLIPIADGRPRLRVVPEPTEDAWRLAVRVSVSGSDDDRWPRETTHDPRRGGPRVEMIAVDLGTGPSGRCVCFTGEELTACRCSGEETPRGRFVLPVDIREAGRGPVTLKVVAADERGRRTAAWTNIAAPSRRAVQLAFGGNRRR